MEEIEAKAEQQLVANSGIPISESDPNPPSACQSSVTDPAEGVVAESGSESPANRTDIFRAVEVVERDSIAIAESFSSLFDSLRLVLSEVTSNSVDHMHCFSDAAGRLQESVLDAATKGNRYINSCLRLNQEMKGMDSLATQLKILRRNVDALDVAVNKLLHIP
ncbi:uncharacterized protein LOC107405980 [Ziziphus jujuba]|uniref:Uncharacterized protein LOC107405980 n=1 Tax=Ziziphus jujuba TaxID=326968 RepID=A0A6P3YX63_ZIZJJ|nr:uncharacterized protein LOC107405980 [Ziziphus jujuba]